MSARAPRAGVRRGRLVALAAAVLAAGCLKVELPEIQGGFAGTIDAPVPEVWEIVAQAFAAYSIEVEPPRPGTKARFGVAGAAFFVEVEPADDGPGTTVFVACDCPWPATRELLDAVLDDAQAAGLGVERPRYPAADPSAPDPSVGDELRRRRGR